MRYIICAALALVMLLGSFALAEEEAWIIDDSETYAQPKWMGTGMDILLDIMPIYIDARDKTYTLELWGTHYPEYTKWTTFDDAFIMDGDTFVQQLSLGIEMWAKDEKFVVYLDANFDGYRDLMFCDNAFRDVSHYQYWLWNQEEDKFVMSPSFSQVPTHPVFYPEAGRIGAHISLQVGRWLQGFLYEVVGDTVVLIKEVEMHSDDDQPLWWSDIEPLLWDE